MIEGFFHRHAASGVSRCGKQVDGGIYGSDHGKSRHAFAGFLRWRRALPGASAKAGRFQDRSIDEGDAFRAQHGDHIFTWIGKLGGASKLGEALFAYPIGLLLALLWYYVRMSLLNLGSDNKNVKLVAFAHIAGVTIMTLAAAYVFAWPLSLGVRG